MHTALTSEIHDRVHTPNKSLDHDLDRKLYFLHNYKLVRHIRSTVANHPTGCEALDFSVHVVREKISSLLWQLTRLPIKGSVKPELKKELNFYSFHLNLIFTYLPFMAILEFQVKLNKNHRLLPVFIVASKTYHLILTLYKAPPAPNINLLSYQRQRTIFLITTYCFELQYTVLRSFKVAS